MSSPRSSSVAPPRHVQIHSKERVFDGHHKIGQYTISHDAFDGSTIGPMSREVISRGYAVAVLTYDPTHDKVILIKQFRLPAHVHCIESGWLWEIVAGMTEEGEAPEDVARREAQEEAGLVLNTLTRIQKFHPTPGYSDEIVDLFYAEVDSTTAQGLHGMPDEFEDIEVTVLPWSEVEQLITSGAIVNAITLIALQWLQVNRPKLLQIDNV